MKAFLRRQPTWLLALVMGVLASAFSASGAWIPSYWGDEAASVMSAERPLASLEPMLERVDAVHGFFYVVLHFWVKLWGASPLAVRSLSALCVGIAAAGLVVLFGMYRHRTLAVLAAVMFAVLPRVTYIGVEARSYALSAACATWLTLLFLFLTKKFLEGIDRGAGISWRSFTTWGWVLYVAGIVLSVHVFLYLLLLLPAHGVVLLSHTRQWQVLTRWAASVVLALIMTWSFIREAVGEHRQIAFLAHRAPIDLHNIVVTQWFTHWWVAIIAWPLILVGLFAPGFSSLKNNRSVRNITKTRSHLPALPILAASWIVIPTGLLWILNSVTPVYADRYLSFVTPALAIAMALGLGFVRWTWLKLVLVAAVIAATVPGYLSQRTPYAKNNGTDWNVVADVISLNAQPGDAILFDPTERNSRKPRLAEHLYPEQFAKVKDVALSVPYSQRAWLWDAAAPVGTLNAQLATQQRIWAVEGTKTSTWGLHDLETLGFHVVRKYPVNISVVYELER